tara:strand:+ start:235 stop:807 length:573 start_codon:yes stop_codon:yes gene_type:complete
MRLLFKLLTFVFLFSSCVTSFQVEKVSMSLGKVIPNIHSKSDQIDISWNTWGWSFGVNLGGHYFEGKYMLGKEGSMDTFYYKDSSSGTPVMQEVRSIFLNVMGIYYTPFFGHGFQMGAGLERWSLGFKSSDSQVHIYTPLLDIGYQFGDKSGDNWWDYLIGSDGKSSWTIMIRTTNFLKPIYQLKFNLEF